MSTCVSYRDFASRDKPTEYCDNRFCYEKFKKDDWVKVCENNHIFHEKCWTGECTTEVCREKADAFKERVFVAGTVIGAPIVATAVSLGAVVAYNAICSVGSVVLRELGFKLIRFII